MGQRELRRVPLDFSWPIDQIWFGFVNPYPDEPKCDSCDGTGYNKATYDLAQQFYNFREYGTGWHDKITQDEVQALVDKGRLYEWTHVHVRRQPDDDSKPGTTWGWIRRADAYVPTADEINAAQHLGGLRGHDAFNRWILIEARATRLGVWGHCEQCHGNGVLPYPHGVFRYLHDTWKPTDPPTGPGYQLWETTTEGSPQSPVFKTAQQLAQWCANNATLAGRERASYDTWLRMFNDNSVEDGSFIIHDVATGYFGSVANMESR